MKYGTFYYLWSLIFIAVLSLSDGYRNIRLQDYLCADKLLLTLQKPFRGNPHFTLMEDRESSVTVSQIWNTTLPGVFSSFSNNKMKNECRFSVRTMPHTERGIYIMITQLTFRKDPVTGNCLDYIQFFDGNNPPSERICGEISIDGPGERSYANDRYREVEVFIHIDKKTSILDPLKLHMVLTAHSLCKFSEDFLCDLNDKASCISSSLVNDNITNCPPPCRDEKGCYHDPIIATEINPANVALSAITSLIFTMLGVGFFVWVCWKYWNCITAQHQAENAGTAAGATSTRRGPLEAPVFELPTAPPFNNIAVQEQNQQQQQPQTPKDFPPSYESLFPDR